MRIWERGAQSNSLGRAWEVSTRFRASWVALWLGCLGGARGKELLRNPDWLVGDRLFGERVGNETLGGVLRLGGGSAGQGLRSQGSYGRWGYRAAALWEWGASIQCSLRPYPAAAGLSWGARGEDLLRNGAGLVRDRLFGERVGNGTLGGVLHLGGGLAAGLSWGAWCEELLRNGVGLVRDRLFGERVGTLGGVLRLGGGLAAGVSGWGVR